MRGQPTEDDLRQVREFQEILQLPTRQEIRLALIRQEPPSTDTADCICAALKDCAETDNPCPYCRTLDPYSPCPELGYGCGLLDDACDCCTPAQRLAAAKGRS